MKKNNNKTFRLLCIFANLYLLISSLVFGLILLETSNRMETEGFSQIYSWFYVLSLITLVICLIAQLLIMFVENVQLKKLAIFEIAFVVFEGIIFTLGVINWQLMIKTILTALIALVLHIL
ncbi:hypothetical protein AKUA2001_05390 [Apilactobacillus kunkeei]|nr:hypothetical protein AKUA1802_05370 [Apilactobacillus kunkeei]CAI2585454.1 hypothetical protein AKUA0901_05370 [Apilactobacillus kunkeei]CAI2585898.1 hypothetical protein AKUA1201_05370 [Apilactobacillus kunkeei]CAI2585915.1 hypothetical protein AKUA1002_05370 [Apilactobacillus kunkeei]CAI2648835.1 hypothetical protein AKUA2102_04700 [Apilactobacillus kunkeei]